MDTHDTPLIPVSTAIEKGVCFSVEPGLYFDPDDITLPKSLRQRGQRRESAMNVRHDAGALTLIKRAGDREKWEECIASATTRRK